MSRRFVGGELYVYVLITVDLRGVAPDIRDLGTGLDTSRDDGQAVLPWSEGTNMITFTLFHKGTDAMATLTLRASGTEPKLKWYLECEKEEPIESVVAWLSQNL